MGKITYHDGPLPELATPDGLRAWLEAKGLEEEVGKAGTAENCPLAAFCRTERSGLLVAVGDDSVDLGLDAYPHERWSQIFVREVDKEHGGSPISAGLALELLELAIERAEVEPVDPELAADDVGYGPELDNEGEW